ncbi:MAG: LemA family protein [Candidatus Woesearchaeota archaeon]
MMTWILIGALIIFVLFVWMLYNGLIRLKNQVDNAWAQIDVQLKRRYDLIPNLIEAVKGYMKHEKGVLESVTKARTSLMQADTVGKKAQADNMLAGTLKSLFAVAENYPQLKANENFLQLQEELAGTENKIAYARQHYNDMVMSFNTRIELFPNNLFARFLSFTKRESFKTEGAQRENIKVSF